ncbi:MAG: acylphosphatase [Steroidobacter sp.]
MSNLIARRCYISGRVQGVFYRASTRQKAVELGCAGYACNLDDGRVEVLAVGETQAVQSLLDWLWRGSPGSDVKFVEVREIALDDLGDVPVGVATR